MDTKPNFMDQKDHKNQKNRKFSKPESMAFKMLAVRFYYVLSAEA